MLNVSVRPAFRADLPILVTIYNHYILNSHATFEIELTTVDRRTEWFENFGDNRYQLLVAEVDGTVVGSAHSIRYRPHPAFDATVEIGVYLDPSHRGHGVGAALYRALLERLAAQDVHLLVAGIALPNDASIALHRKFGFEEVGVFKEYARKHGRFISSVWLQRLIAGSHAPPP